MLHVRAKEKKRKSTSTMAYPELLAGSVWPAPSCFALAVAEESGNQLLRLPSVRFVAWPLVLAMEPYNMII